MTKRHKTADKKLPQPPEPASIAPIVEHHERKIAEAKAAKKSVVPASAKAESLDLDQLVKLYCRVMRETEGVFVKYESYVVRVWDGMDGCWTDCTGEVGREEALRYWAEQTDGGTHHVAYSEIDYYRIFPGNTRMLWDGSEGLEMHR